VIKYIHFSLLSCHWSKNNLILTVFVGSCSDNIILFHVILEEWCNCLPWRTRKCNWINCCWTSCKCFGFH